MLAGRGVFWGVLALAFGSLGLADPVSYGIITEGSFLTTITISPGLPPCALGMPLVSGALIAGATLSEGRECAEGIFTFSNFTVYGASTPAPITAPYVWDLWLAPVTDAAGLDLDFAFTDLGTTGDDFQLTFTITPGISDVTLSAGPGTSVTESICSSPFSAAGLCEGIALAGIFGASNGGSSFSNVAPAGANYVFVNVVNGSEFSESINPEPATFSLMGLGLAAVGFLGRRKLRRG